MLCAPGLESSPLISGLKELNDPMSVGAGRCRRQSIRAHLPFPALSILSNHVLRLLIVSQTQKARRSHFAIASRLLERDLTNYSGLDPSHGCIGFWLWFKRTSIGKIGFQLLEEILDLCTNSL